MAGQNGWFRLDAGNQDYYQVNTLVYKFLFAFFNFQEWRPAHNSGKFQQSRGRNAGIGSERWYSALERAQKVDFGQEPH